MGGPLAAHEYRTRWSLTFTGSGPRTAQQHVVSNRTASTYDRGSDLDTSMDATHDVSSDLGWKSQEEPKHKRRKSPREATEEDYVEDDGAEGVAHGLGESAKVGPCPCAVPCSNPWSL